MSDSSYDSTDPVGGLASDAWRDRKQATDELVRRLQQARTLGESEGERALMGDVLKVVVSPATPSARAAASEVLTRLGVVSVPFLKAALLGNPEATRPLVEVLGTVADEGDLLLFSDLFQSSGADENLRCVLVTAVARQRGEASVALLAEMLKDPSEVVRLHVLDGYMMLGVVPSSEVLEALLDRPTLRRTVIDLLGQSPDKSALRLVWGQLSGGLPGVRSVAARSAVQLLSQRFDTDAEAEECVAGLGAEDSLLDGITSLLEHSDTRAVSAAARLLALIGKDDSFGSLLQVLNVGEVLDAARLMLRRLGPAGHSMLRAALEDDGQGGCYAQRLELIGALEASDVEDDLLARLDRELENDDEGVVSAAIKSIGRVGVMRQLSSLVRVCERDDGLGDMAADAVADVLMREGELAIPLAVVADSKWPSTGSLARNLCRVAGRLGSDSSVASLVFLLASSDVDVRVAAAHALGAIPGEHEGVGALAFALADEEAHVRAAACRSLGAIGRIESLNSLLAASADVTSLVRAAAVQALIQLDNPVAASRMREIILEDSSPTVVVHAIEGLKVADDEQTLGLVMSLCSSSDTEVAKAAARVLRGFPSHRATAALIGLLAHERWDVRWAAAESLGARDDPTAVGAIREVLSIESDALVVRTLQDTLKRLLGAATQTDPPRGDNHG